MRIRRFSGFTIVELIVVISIIGILASIALPSLLRGREAALVRDAGTVLQGIRHAENSFLIDNGVLGTIPQLVIANNLAAHPNFQSPEWTFGVNTGTAKMTAIRQGGAWDAGTIVMDLDGKVLAASTHQLAKYADF